MLLALPVPVLASTMIPHTLAQRAGISTRVVVAKVQSQVTTMEGNEPRSLRTLTSIEVQQDVRGSGPAKLTVVQLGGRKDGWSAEVPGDARFQPGETAVLFLNCRAADRCTLVSLAEGRLAVMGDQVVVHDMFTNAWSKRPLVEVVKELKAAPAVSVPAPGVVPGKVAR